MRLMLFDVAVNAAMLAATVALLVLLRKKRDVRWLGGALLGYGVAIAMGTVLSIGVMGHFAAMRALAWSIFVHGVAAGAGIAALFWKTRRPVGVGAAGLAALAALVGVDAFFIEPHSLEVTRFKLASAKVSRPLKIAILADVQADEIGEYERAAIELAVREKPDLYLFAGDYIQERDSGRRRTLYLALRAALKDAGLQGPKAAVAVEGNCDSDDWPSAFEGTGVAHTKETTTVRQGDFELTALSLADSFNTRLSVGESNLFHIVLGHAPDYALGDVRADLLVAGHTHGGQVRLPFIGPLVTLSQVPRAWAAGMTPLPGGRTLVVSRGIGMERGRAPRLRFLCRPQLVFIDVVPQR